MNICFVLPKFSRKPIGGFKIIYQYANGIAQTNNVLLFYLNEKTFLNYHIPKYIKNVGNQLMTIMEPTWFRLKGNIQKRTLKSKDYMNALSKQDIIIATSIDTVDFVVHLNLKSRKYYFIQDFENWDYSDEYVYSTYQMGLGNIVVSDWLKKIVESKSGQKAFLLRNPIDTNIYRPITDYTSRKEHTIGLLYHSAEYKGLKYAFDVLEQLKSVYEDLSVYMFGTTRPSQQLPEWIHFTYNATERQTVKIYNSVQIFLCATVQEGYGLTGLEAMACGAALVSTDYKGVHEYAQDGFNALLSPVKDVNALFNNVCLLFDNTEERYRIIRNGLESVKSFSWEYAFDNFLNILEQ